MIERRRKRDFLDQNPFENGLTDGLFYREKMRAIHTIAPSCLPADARIIEIGGGRSGMARKLYPEAHVTTVDIDPTLAPERTEDEKTQFIQGDARALPFDSQSFDMVTMFDVLEHINEDYQAAAEARRIIRPGGWILMSTPYSDWHYPKYGFMRSVCPHEQVLMDEWGHVRRGYSPSQISDLFGRQPDTCANFINPVTAFYHDIAFSHLSRRKRKLLYLAAALPTFAAYVLHRPGTSGSEMACVWRM